MKHELNAAGKKALKESSSSELESILLNLYRSHESSKEYAYFCAASAEYHKRVGDARYDEYFAELEDRYKAIAVNDKT